MSLRMVLLLPAAGLWILAAAQAQPAQHLIFSHRRHLARAGTTCQDCHTTVEGSTAAGEDNRPKEATCLRCHDGRQASKQCAACHRNAQAPRGLVAAAPRAYRFDHRQHLAFGNVAPALAAALDRGKYLGRPGDLRRYLNSDNACQACHRGLSETDQTTAAHLPRMADCLVCHTRIDPPFSCGFCHTPEAVLLPADHTPQFSDAHADPIRVPDKTECKVCHGVNFSCMGCH